MNITPYDYPVVAKEVTSASMNEFLEKIQAMINRAGHAFLIDRTDLARQSSLQISQILGTSQNVLISGLIQLREEMTTYQNVLGDNQRTLMTGLERFFHIFTKYQNNLSQALGELGALFKPIKESNEQNFAALYEYIKIVEKSIKIDMGLLGEQIQKLRSELITADFFKSPNQITQAVVNTEKRIIQIINEVRSEVLSSFDQRIQLIEETCAEILKETHSLSKLPETIIQQNQTNYELHTAMLTEIHNKIEKLQVGLNTTHARVSIQEQKIDSLIRACKDEGKSISIPQRDAQLKPPNKPLGSINLNMMHL